MIGNLPARALALTLLAAPLGGCYRYVGAEIAPVPQGEPVRMHVTPAGMTELRALSPEAGAIVSGVVMSWADDGVMLRVPDRRGPTVVMGEAIGQDVRIPTREIMQLERRRMDPVRTALATGVGVALVSAAIVTIVSDAFGGEDVQPSGPDVQLRIPFF